MGKIDNLVEFRTNQQKEEMSVMLENSEYC